MEENNYNKINWGGYTLLAIIAIIIFLAFRLGTKESTPTTVPPAKTLVENPSSSTPTPSYSDREYLPPSREVKPRNHKSNYYDPYNDGYEEGYSDGIYDCNYGRAHRESFDDSNDYNKKSSAKYCEGYEEGYEDGYASGDPDSFED